MLGARLYVMQLYYRNSRELLGGRPEEASLRSNARRTQSLTLRRSALAARHTASNRLGPIRTWRLWAFASSL